MRTLISFGLASAAMLTLGACTTGPDRETQLTPKQAKHLASLLDGKVAGEPVDCVSATRTTGLTPISDDVLIYRVSGRKVYKNDLNGSCSGLDWGDPLLLEVFGGQYCRGDPAKVIDAHTGTLRGFCTLGSFVPYEKPKS